PSSRSIADVGPLRPVPTAGNKSVLELIDTGQPVAGEALAIAFRARAGKDGDPFAGPVLPGEVAGEPSGAACNPFIAVDEGERSRGGGGELALDEREMGAGED